MAKTFPYLEVSGTHKDVGRAIGKMWGDKIQQSICWRRENIPDYPQHLKNVEKYVNATEDDFPKLIEEAESIAAAAGVPFLDYFFMNNPEEYSVDEEWVKKNVPIIEHCTIAVSFNDKDVVVGHNEDWAPDAIDSLYILRATIGRTTHLGLQYGTVFPGCSAAMNSWGLVQCINDLYQNTQVGVPKYFLARAILECKTLDEAEGLIHKTKRASGFNHVLIQDHEARNVEIANNTVAVEKVIEGSYVHTNHYLSPEMETLEKFHTKSSEARLQRARQLAKPAMTKEEMVTLLSDKQNSEFPICRPDATIGSLVFIPGKSEVWICYGHPCAGEYIKYTL